MLLNLRISNFALVEDIEIQFDKGLSVLTGETGAGKSVIVTALGLVLGDRADRDHIRHGATQTVVEATFSVDRMNRAYRDEFAEHFVENRFTVRRENSRDGASKVKINGRNATVALLKQLTSPLAEILGQHSSRLLLDEDNHLLFLDSFAGVDDLREEVGHLFVSWDKASSELRRTLKKRDDLDRERELLLFQQNEIKTAEISEGEEASLTRERRVLDSSRALIEAAETIDSIVSDEQSGLIDNLKHLRKQLDKMAAVDERLEAQARQAEDIDFQLEDLRASIEAYGSSVPDDPNRLEEINVRLDEIYRLKQKYGGSESRILKTLEEIGHKLKDRPDATSLISELQECEAERRAAYAAKAVQLSEVRQKAAAYLSKLAVKELSELAVSHGRFDTEFLYDYHDDGLDLNGRNVRAFAHGLESCRFIFSANPGEPLKPLVKTASGGEISRLLLALKAAEKKNRDLKQSLLVFDEVDAGIGGQTALEVGKKIKRLSDTSQVLVITHLHQIARLADHHYLAEKTDSRGKRVTIRVTRLQGKTVDAELSRMVALPE